MDRTPTANDPLPSWAPGYRHLTVEVAPIPFQAPAEPEDFRVEELPLFEPEGVGTHLFLTIEKRGISTVEAVRRLGAALGRRPREFGFAGRKDTRAVARQRLSIEHVDPDRLRDLELPGLRVLALDRHPRMLRLGQLRGNRFQIVLRGVRATDRGRLEQVLEHLGRDGLPNYFGPQRFGKGGRNHVLGWLLAKGRHAEYLEASGGGSSLRAVPWPTRSFHLAALQSRVFNRVLAARLGEPPGMGRLVVGDVARFHGAGSCLRVEGAAELADLEPRVASWELGPTGPLPAPPGSTVLTPAGRPAQMERTAMEAEDLAPSDLADLPDGLTPRGDRRHLRAAVGELEVSRRGDETTLSFTLPRGSFASVLLEELAKCHARPCPA